MPGGVSGGTRRFTGSASRRLRLLRRDRPGVDHGLEDGVGPLLGASEIARRGELGRRPHQAGEHGGFGERELLRRLGEVAPCGGIDPVGAGAEVGRVQVAQEDLLLAELALQPEGNDGLLDLAAQVLVGRQEHQARQLLGDGAAALARAAGLPVAPGGPQDAPWIDAEVAVEASVLDGHDGLGEVGGHVGCRDLGALEDAAGREGLAAIRLDDQGARGRVDLQAAVQRQGRDAVADDQDQQDGEAAGDDEGVAAAGCAPGRAALPCQHVLAPRMIGSRHGPRTVAARVAAARARRRAPAYMGRVRAATISASRLPSSMAFRPAGGTRAASRPKREGAGVCAGSANDRMSLCGLGPEGSSEVGVGVVTILGFPLLRLYNPDTRFALRRAGRLVPKPKRGRSRASATASPERRRTSSQDGGNERPGRTVTFNSNNPIIISLI